MGNFYREGELLLTAYTSKGHGGRLAYHRRVYKTLPIDKWFHPKST